MNRGVVLRRVPERLDREPLARGVGQAAAGADFVGHRGVVRGIDDDAHVGVVLGRGAHHRRAADVDHLDDVAQSDALGAGRLLERVEVDHDEIDRFDVVVREIFHVARVVAQREDAAVDSRVQRLDPAVEHLRKPRVVGHRGDPDALFPQEPCRAAARQDLDAAVGKRTGQVDDAVLVEHGKQRAANLSVHQGLPESFFSDASR